MNTLILGLIVFFSVHSVAIVNATWRDRMAARMGEWTWKAVYGLIAIVGLLLIIRGYSEARLDPVVLYISPQWLHYVAMLLLVPVFPLLFAAYLPGRIHSAAKHPMLAATKLWALAHLLVNGAVPDVLLFGAFLVWAVTDRISLKYRATPPVPSVPYSRFNDIAAAVLGLGLYAAFIYGLHAWLIGVPVIAR
jgi:uncharacterized membrane protein